MDLTVSDVDRGLVERARSGDRSAFAELFATLREPLLAAILGGETTGSGEAGGGR